jgi:hypothetical protein
MKTNLTRLERLYLTAGLCLIGFAVSVGCLMSR